MDKKDIEVVVLYQDSSEDKVVHEELAHPSLLNHNQQPIQSQPQPHPQPQPQPQSQKPKLLLPPNIDKNSQNINENKVPLPGQSVPGEAISNEQKKPIQPTKGQNPYSKLLSDSEKSQISSDLHHIHVASGPPKKKIDDLFVIADQNEEHGQVDSAEPIKKRELNIEVDPHKQDELKVAEPLNAAPQQQTNNINRVIGIILLCLIGGIFWVYGWASSHRPITNLTEPVNTTTQPIFGGLLIMTAIFTVIGFGMLFMYFKRSSQSALFTSIFITSFTCLISPIFQKYWYNVLVTDFSGTAISTQNPSYMYNQSMGGTNIYFDLYNFKICLLNSISQLVVLLSLFGKLNIAQLASFSFLYNFAWNFNCYALFNVQNKAPDLRFYDDFQINSVYLFAGCFGLIPTIALKKPPLTDAVQRSKNSSIFAHIGMFFLFFTFCATTILFSMKNSTPGFERNYIWQEAFISCFFAESSAILFSYAFSILFKDKISVKESIFSMIMGAIIYGTIAGVCINIGAAIACGLAAGLLVAVYFRFIQPLINSRRVIDSYGLFLLLAISLIATLLIPQVVLRGYYNYGVKIQTLQSSSTGSAEAVPNKDVAGYELTYPAITAVVACGSSLILTIFLKLLDNLDADKIFSDKLYFVPTHGLRQTKQKSPPPVFVNSITHNTSINQSNKRPLEELNKNEEEKQKEKQKQPSQQTLPKEANPRSSQKLNENERDEEQVEIKFSFVVNKSAKKEEEISINNNQQTFPPSENKNQINQINSAHQEDNKVKQSSQIPLSGQQPKQLQPAQQNKPEEEKPVLDQPINHQQVKPDSASIDPKVPEEGKAQPAPSNQ